MVAAGSIRPRPDHRRRRGSPARVRVGSGECMQLAGLGIGIGSKMASLPLSLPSSSFASLEALGKSKNDDLYKGIFGDALDAKKGMLYVPDRRPPQPTARTTEPNAPGRPRPTRRRRREGLLHVRFNLEQSTVHEVPAYAEVYGLHPREFLFTQSDFMLIGYNDCLAPHHRTTEYDEDDDISADEDETRQGGIQQETLHDDWVVIS
mmetsp:Transcript_10004/g.22408  ORF Transcript_10004/g.22408 Transcript_10004/m.22408 type:complete len:206 (+) Transcript_10004:73-690(+)